MHFVCADDAHGAPIMIAADKAGQDAAGSSSPRSPPAGSPILDGFHISFDNWHSTDGPENHELAKDIYLHLRKEGLIAVKAVEQFFDPVKSMFLPDRYIRGECPVCGTPDRYGDSCDVCGSVYAATALKNPHSALSGATPVLKSSEHYFFQLSSQRCLDFLKRWTNEPGRLQPEVLNKISEWFKVDEHGHGGLADWDISRDAPYFGIEIPDAPGKYFYVWLDAPVGYLASLKNYFDKGGAKAKGEPRSFDEFMADPAVEQIHFIGKDITYFHTLFWPAMLKFSGRKVPDRDLRPRLHHRQRREDEQEPRHRHLAAALPRDRHERRVAALLHRRQAQRPRRGHRVQSRRLRRPRQLRPGRQVRQHRQPRGGLRATSSSTAALRFGGDAAAARRARRAAPTRRPRSPRSTKRARYGKVVREVMELADCVNGYLDAAQAVAARQGSDARRRAAGRLLARRLQPDSRVLSTC